MDYKNMQEYVSKGLKIFGQIDILINNAGVSYRGEISDTQICVDEKVMAVNYFGQIALVKGEFEEEKNLTCFTYFSSYVILYVHRHSNRRCEYLLMKKLSSFKQTSNTIF